MKSILINLLGFLSSIKRMFTIRLFAMILLIERHFYKRVLKFQINQLTLKFIYSFSENYFCSTSEDDVSLKLISEENGKLEEEG